MNGKLWYWLEKWRGSGVSKNWGRAVCCNLMKQVQGDIRCVNSDKGDRIKKLALIYASVFGTICHLLVLFGTLWYYSISFGTSVCHWVPLASIQYHNILRKSWSDFQTKGNLGLSLNLNTCQKKSLYLDPRLRL